MDVSENRINIRFDESDETFILKYFIDSFNRLTRLSSNLSTKVVNNKDMLDKIVQELGLQLTRNIILVLLGVFSSTTHIDRIKSKLTPFLMNQYVSGDFLYQIMTESIIMRSNLTNGENAFESVGQINF
jgi:hypothetical protein